MPRGAGGIAGQLNASTDARWRHRFEVHGRIENLAAAYRKIGDIQG